MPVIQPERWVIAMHVERHMNAYNDSDVEHFALPEVA